MKKPVKIILILLLLAVVSIVIVQGTRLYRYKQKAAATIIEAVDLSRIPDGIYQGEYDLDYVNATVAVSVRDSKIIEVRIIEHKHERGQDAEEQIPEKIVQQQTVKVDAVSGATNSSKAIMKAAELALRAGLK